MPDTFLLHSRAPDLHWTSWARYLPASQQGPEFTLDFSRPRIYTGLFQTCLSTGAITCPFPPLFQRVFLPGQGIPDEPPNVLPIVRVPGWERRLLETMQLAIGEFITDSSQGLPPSPRMWGQKAPSPSSLRYLLGQKKAASSWRKWIGYTAGSWHKRIGYIVARLFLLAQRGAFSFPLIGSFSLVWHMLIGWLQEAW